MIHGWFTDLPSWRGRGGTRIQGFGLAAPTSLSDSGLESDGSAASVGAGGIGDLIGAADTRCTTAAGTTPGAGRFTTAAISTEEEHAAEQADFVQAAVRGPSMETIALPEVTRRLAVRAASALERSAATTVADKQGAFHRAAEPALGVADSMVVEERAEAVAATDRESALGHR